MWELFPHLMRRASFHQSSEICRQGRRICPNEEMHMVTLTSQVNNLPIMLIGHFMDDLLKPTGHRTIEDLSTSPWTTENIVHHQMDGMVLLNVFHVYGLPCIDTFVNRRTQKSPCALAPN